VHRWPGPVASPQRRIRLHAHRSCAVCGCGLVRGAEAWWDAEGRTTCVACGDGGDVGLELSGRAKRVRGHFGGRIGRLVLGPSERADGAGGCNTDEHRLGVLLERSLPSGAVLLHDRRVPGTNVSVDHVVVAPSGVWLIGARAYRGRVERRPVRPFRRVELRLCVGGRDRTKLARVLAAAMRAVKAAVSHEPGADIHPTMCLVAADWSLVGKPFEFEGVLVTWPRKLAELISQPGTLSAGAVARLADRIAVDFLPA
jgi:hypothetical protein